MTVSKHDGEVHRAIFDLRTDKWRATCLPCGWQGEKRDTQQEAADDLREHEKT